MLREREREREGERGWRDRGGEGERDIERERGDILRETYKVVESIAE